MKKSAILILPLFFNLFSNNAFAQYSQTREILIQEKLHENCSKRPNINLEYQADTMPIISNISYRELAATGGQKHGTMLYGLYTNQLNIQTNYKVSEYMVADKSCFFISDLQFLVKIVPNIYIAQEAAQFPCMRNKVYEHEMAHHRFFMEALHGENENLKRDLRDKFSSVPFKYHSADIPIISEFVKTNIANIQSNFISQINNRKTPYDKHLDDPQNTAREHQQCQHEIQHLNSLYRR